MKGSSGLCVFQMWGSFVFLAVAVMAWSGCASTELSSYTITIHSYVTAEGRLHPAATKARPTRYSLVTAGHRVIGDSRAGDGDVDSVQVIRLVHDALQAAHYRACGPHDHSPDLVLVFRWGTAIPEPERDGMTSTYADLQMLDLVGGRSLSNLDLQSEKDALHHEAREARYYLSVAAYRFSKGAVQDIGPLYWRTQISVPIADLTLQRALPLLAAAGVRIFGSATAVPIRIALRVSGTLVPGWARPPQHEIEECGAVRDDTDERDNRS